MAFSRLFIFVEGDDDERFFEYVIKPALQDKYDWIDLIKYAGSKHEKIANYLKSIESMNADYIFVSDINAKPCITAKKQSLLTQYSDLDESKIVVVRTEIEGWYLAGLDNSACKKLKLRNFRVTDNVSKEQFESLMPKEFDSRRDFMIEVLKHFSIDVAKEKNTSFRYFANKHDC